MCMCCLSVVPVGYHGGSQSVHLLGGVTVHPISLLHGYRARTVPVCSESHTERTVFCPENDRLPYGRSGATLGRY